MADQKITALPLLTDPAPGDLLVIVDDPAGTPISKRVTVADVVALVEADAPRWAFVDGATGTLTDHYGFASASRTSAGVYRLTLAAGLSPLIAVVQPLGTVPTTGLISPVSSTEFDVRLFNLTPGNPTDCSFHVVTRGTA
jgi:hypothetical protein